ncbi:hypothetical protein [Flavobacterium quisquiliarum]|uniref:Uncharacterized protein n=1 Tax=Flavobacterium quisquiliarum TaxID=1834436 RepID=A0ABV8W775_9FLAO|nr:hypothetical protein [Flavobacterium quisquiliarum]MBW1654948.1 hypothetical protein [Flavobacterium quisquiliarum]
MVSIDNRITYKDRIKSSAKLVAFDQFLSGTAVDLNLNSEVSDSDKQFVNMIAAIQTNNKTAFEQIYSLKNKSNPSRDSPAPFVNDDYLILILIIGIQKFGFNNNWIKNILSIRSRNIITITLENILNKNYSSTSNQMEVVLVYLNLYDQSFINNQLLNNTFKSIMQNTVLFENRNDFQILSALRAYELIIELKEGPEGSEMHLLKKFNDSFIRRTKILSWLLQASLFSFAVYGLLKLPVYSPEFVKKINDYGYVFTLIGASGITILSNQLSFIKRKSQEFTMRMLGYPKEMLKQS